MKTSTTFVSTTITTILALGASLLAANLAHAQTGALNDTGATQCVASGALAPCSAANTGDGAPEPRQDGRFGRDAASINGGLVKIGGGAAGFDFTRICWNGSPEGTTSGPNPCTGTLVANFGNAPSATPATDWACTRDNLTGIVWSLATGTGTLDVVRAATYPDAGHNTPVRCGFGSGWRLPTRVELHSIVHYGATYPSIDANYFPDTGKDFYYTSDVYALNPNYNWAVSFDSGRIFIPTPASYLTRLAHSTVSAPAPGYIDNGDGTVSDTVTGLMWDKCTYGLTNNDCGGGSATPLYWKPSLALAVAANGANYKGHNDWRLPNIKELSALVDLTRTPGPTINTTLFPNTFSDSYWSATTSPISASADKNLEIDFNSGVLYVANPLNAHVRLVRNSTVPAAYDLLSNGACGPANGVVTVNAPTTNLCNVGTPSAVDGTTNPANFTWTCSQSGGTTAQCSAPRFMVKATLSRKTHGSAGTFDLPVQ